MQTSPNRNVIILFVGLLLLLILVFRQAGVTTTSAAHPITFVSPLRVTPVVEPVSLAVITAPQLLTMTRPLTPTLPHDLLFVNENGLLRWRHAAQQLETIVATPVVTKTAVQQMWHNIEYVMSNDRRKLLITYGAGTYGNPATQHLALYDTVHATVTALLTTTYDMDYLTIAHDNRWIAYLQRDVPRPPRPWWRRLFSRNGCGCGEGPYEATVYVIKLQPPYTPQKIAVCGRSPRGNGECEGIQGLLSDETHVAWLDGAGFWHADLQQMNSTLLAKPGLWKIWPWRRVAPLGGDASEQQLIVRIARYAENLSGFGLLDPLTWRLLLLPEWLPPTSEGQLFDALDGQSFLWTSFNRADPLPQPQLAMWRLQGQPPHEQFTKTEFQLPFPPTAHTMFAQPLTNGKIGIVLLNRAPQTTWASGLYTLDPTTARLTRLNHLPTWTDSSVDSGYAIWSLNGAGALYLEHIPQTPLANVAYVPADGAPLVDLTSLLGQQPDQIRWLLADTAP